jgi:adenine-specific DNA-methyltransferase
MESGALNVADVVRREINGTLTDTRSRLGQFMTPAATADFMASLIQTKKQHVHILDPGAGVGSLTAAAIDRLLARSPTPKTIHATCYEIDPRLSTGLSHTLAECQRSCEMAGVRFTWELHELDYIESQANTGLFGHDTGDFDVVIMNPPYRKINGSSRDRRLLSAVGIETTNLYSAFMLLAARQLVRNGEFISINPRSFCNGPYFRSFRLELLDLLDLRRVHVFESRKDTFREDDVLQENVIVYGRRRADQSATIDVSTTSPDGQIALRRVPSHSVRRPDDRDAVLHVLVDDQADAVAAHLSALPDTLLSLGLAVSTGRVVDFRAREFLRQDPQPGAVPLIFSAHFNEGTICWPVVDSRKPNAIVATEETRKLLVRRGAYVLIRRFSAKEERRRVVAALYDPSTMVAEYVGFDNKTNYIHAQGEGLDLDIARGLTVYLNSTMLDAYFRTFSGHTQVNASDVRRLPFPSHKQLRVLASASSLAKQDEVDAVVERVLQSVE